MTYSIPTKFLTFIYNFLKFVEIILIKKDKGKLSSDIHNFFLIITFVYSLIFCHLRYNRKLGYSISHDGGYTWEDSEIIIDNFELAKRLGFTKKQALKAVKNEEKVGFFEPFIMMLNNEIKVFYADDFTPMLNHTSNDNPYYNYIIQNIYTQTYNIERNYWSKERTLIMDGSIKKSPTGSGLIKRISRD